MRRRCFLKGLTGICGAAAIVVAQAALLDVDEVRCYSNGLFVGQRVVLEPGKTYHHCVFDDCTFVRAHPGNWSSIAIYSSVFHDCMNIEIVTLDRGRRVGVVDFLEGCKLSANREGCILRGRGDADAGSRVLGCRFNLSYLATGLRLG